MSTAGGNSWGSAGTLDPNGTTPGTTPNPTQDPDSSGWWHPSYWTFTAPSDGMLVVDAHPSVLGTDSDDLWLGLFRDGTSTLDAIVVGYADDTIDPSTPDVDRVPKMFAVVESGVEYKAVCGTWDDPPSVVSIVLQSTFYPAGSGVPGWTWDDAGTLDVGRQSFGFGYDEWGANEWWFKFTAPFTGPVVFDMESLSTPSEATPGVGQAHIELYSGPDQGSAVFEADFTDRQPPPSYDNVYLALGSFNVTEGVEYHVKVFDVFDVWEAVLGISDPTRDDWVQPGDHEQINPIGPSFGGTDQHGNDLRQQETLNMPGEDADTATLQSHMNDRLDGVGDETVNNDGNSSTANSEHAGSASVGHTGLGVAFTDSGAQRFSRGVGMAMAPNWDPYVWTYEDNVGDFPEQVAGAEYSDTNVAYLKTEVNPVRTIFQDPDSIGQVLHSQHELRIGPVNDFGSGRQIDLVDLSGDPDDATYGYDLGRIEIGPDDYDNDDQIVWFVPELPLKTGTWIGVVDGQGVFARAVINWYGTGVYVNQMERYDTFRPPEYRLLRAGATTPYSSFVPPDPVRLIWPRPSGPEGPARGRDFPPAKTQQSGGRYGPGAPV